jgi:glycosyltransferase involved in cell wall biosynthesis
MIRNRDIIITGLQPWDTDIGSNCKNIAIEFAKHNRVLYVNYPLDRRTIAKEKDSAFHQKRIDVIKGKKESLVKEDDNIWCLFPPTVIESINWIPFTPLFRSLNKANNKKFAKDIKAAINKLDFKDYILFNDNDIFRSYHLKELLSPAVSIYYLRDNLMGVPYWYKHGRHLEPELMAKTDLVTANSVYLAEVAKKHNPNSFYVGQGCEVDDFDLDKINYVPEDLKNIQGPVIGYIGALFNLRLDLELLEKLAAENAQWSFVFVGPEDEAFKNSRLHHHNNVHFLGLKDTKELPAYLAYFDVAINPQKVNEVTIGNYPRKIDEYLAMGKPVIATETAAMRIFAEHVYFAATAEEYAIQIRKALAEHTKNKEQERIAFARSHTWENSVKDIYSAILKVKPQMAVGSLINVS